MSRISIVSLTMPQATRPATTRAGRNDHVFRRDTLVGHLGA
jgi:hypothetical protein